MVAGTGAAVEQLVVEVAEDMVIAVVVQAGIEAAVEEIRALRVVVARLVAAQ